MPIAYFVIEGPCTSLIFLDAPLACHSMNSFWWPDIVRNALMEGSLSGDLAISNCLIFVVWSFDVHFGRHPTGEPKLRVGSLTDMVVTLGTLRLKNRVLGKRAHILSPPFGYRCLNNVDEYAEGRVAKVHRSWCSSWSRRQCRQILDENHKVGKRYAFATSFA
jgi:hypothetical protein